jgi:hypothetical protein
MNHAQFAVDGSVLDALFAPDADVGASLVRAEARGREFAHQPLNHRLNLPFQLRQASEVAELVVCAYELHQVRDGRLTWRDFARYGNLADFPLQVISRLTAVG